MFKLQRPSPSITFAVLAVAMLHAPLAYAQDSADAESEPTPKVPDVAQTRSLKWQADRFSTADYLATGAAGAVTLAAAIATPLKQHARGGVLFDDRVRDALRLGSSTARYTARDASDVGLSLAATWPIFVDALTTAWWQRGSREVAQEMALIDLEALALAGAVQGATNFAVSRERPYGRDCGGAIPDNTGDCDGTTRFRSFFSGHATFSFTSAALICIHHAKLELLGGPWDAFSCGAGYVVATTTSVLRVAGDMHYATDVITGMLAGTLIGYGVPLLHYAGRTGGGEVVGVRVHIVPSLGGAGVAGTF